MGLRRPERAGSVLLPQPLSEPVEARLTSGLALVLSRLVQAELASAIARKVRTGQLSVNDARSALRVHGAQEKEGAFELVALRDADVRAMTG